MKAHRSLIALAAHVTFASATLLTPRARAAEPAYAELLAARPEATGYPVDGVTLTRDVLRVEFATGSFFPLKAVGGRVDSNASAAQP